MMGVGLCPDDVWHRWKSAPEWAAWYARMGKKPHREGPRNVEIKPEMAEGYEQAPAGFVGRMRVSLLSTLNALEKLS